MKNQVVTIDLPTGRIESISYPGSLGGYVDGYVFSETKMIKFLDSSVVGIEFAKTHHWKEDNWIEHIESPSKYHTFNLITEVWELSQQAIEDLKTQAIADINLETQIKIYSIYPQTKQANLQARWSELVYEDALLGSNSLINQQSSEGLAIKAAWDWIKDLRNRSNTAIATLNTFSDLDTIISDVEQLIATFKAELLNL